MWKKIFEKKKKELVESVVDDAMTAVKQKTREKTVSTLEYVIPLIFLAKDFLPLLTKVSPTTVKSADKAVNVIFNNCTINFTR